MMTMFPDQFKIIMETEWPKEVPALQELAVGCRFAVAPGCDYHAAKSRLEVRVSHVNGQRIDHQNSEAFGTFSGPTRPTRSGESTSQFSGASFTFQASCRDKSFNLEVVIWSWSGDHKKLKMELARCYSPEFQVTAPVVDYKREWYEGEIRRLEAENERLEEESKWHKQGRDQAEHLLQQHRDKNRELSEVLDQADAMELMEIEPDSPTQIDFAADADDCISQSIAMSPTRASMEFAPPEMIKDRLGSVCSSTGSFNGLLSPRPEKREAEPGDVIDWDIDDRPRKRVHCGSMREESVESEEL